jgi:UDP-N-acetylmuramoyl-tripeptide--D-alanyl-D-alanine ligase
MASMKKRLSRFVLHKVLAPLARLVYRKYRPVVVAITGSVGKSTTTETVYKVLSPFFSVKRTEGSGNTGWAVVCALLHPGYRAYSLNADGRGVVQGYHLLWSWLVGVCRFFLPTAYPKVLVLELGVDGPGDMAFFNSLVQYDVAIVTRVGQAHLEFFKDYDELFAEKTSIYSGLKSTGLAVAPDQPDLVELVNRLVVRHSTVGASEGNNIREVAVSVMDNKFRVQLAVDEQNVDIDLPIGRQWIPAAAIATAVGREFGLSLKQIAAALHNLHTVHGRFEVYQLKRGIKLIDDSYNANLDSMKLALISLGDVATSRRIAVLGDMRELGPVSDSAHREVGKLAAGSSLDWLVTVGTLGRLIAEGARSAGMPREKVLEFPEIFTAMDLNQVVDAILGKIGDNDAVLVKASRAMGLDRIVKAIIQKLS